MLRYKMPPRPVRFVSAASFRPRIEVGSAGRGSAKVRAMFRTFAFLFVTVLPLHAAVELGIDNLRAQNFAPLAGRRVGLVTNIRTQIEKGMSPAAIIAGWQPAVAHFRSARQPYLIY